MLRVAYSLMFWVFMLVSSMVLFPLAVVIRLITSAFDPRLRGLHLFTCFWGSLYTWVNPAWTVRVVGREKLDSNRTTILVANHLSLLDVLVAFRLFTHFKWVSKIENFQVPLIGWNMSLNRYIPLRRGAKSSTVQMMKQCRETVAGGNSVMIFPEGTRSPNGRLRRFRSGAFDLAIDTGTAVQPLIIRGTADALPKRGFVLQGRHAISIEVLDVILPEAFADATGEELTQRARELIARELGHGDPLQETPIPLS
ncbi:MAG: lysophospholipid acyltransferase family protein [Myxococcota bacterium]